MDRCATPWLAVAMHRPMYVVFPHKSNRVVGRHLRESLEGVFEDAQVPEPLRLCMESKRFGSITAPGGPPGRVLQVH